MSNVIALVRQSPDWASLDDSYLAEMRAFARLIGRPEDQPERGLRLWNSVARTDYFRTRAALKEIAEGMLAELPYPYIQSSSLGLPLPPLVIPGLVPGIHVGPLLTPQQNDRNDAILHIPEAPTIRPDVDGRDKPGHDAVTNLTWLIPVDDDDWLSPEIPAALAGIEADLAIWRSMVLRDDLQTRPADGICYSNNYAIRAGALAKIDPDPARAIQHWLTDAAARDGRLSIAHIDQPLSIVLRHPASTLVLEQVLATPSPEQELRARIARFAAATAQPNAAPWLQPGLRALADMFNKQIL